MPGAKAYSSGLAPSSVPGVSLPDVEIPVLPALGVPQRQHVALVGAVVDGDAPYPGVGRRQQRPVLGRHEVVALVQPPAGAGVVEVVRVAEAPLDREVDLPEHDRGVGIGSPGGKEGAGHQGAHEGDEHETGGSGHFDGRIDLPEPAPSPHRRTIAHLRHIPFQHVAEEE
jgi:hypothetical protein